MMYGKHLVPQSHEFGRVLLEHWETFVHLQKLMEPTKHEWHPCGSYLMGPASMDYEPAMWSKQILLYNSCKDRRDILEIGVHGGHSLLIALLASPRARVTAIDTCDYTHTKGCVAYLRSQFPDARIQLLEGRSGDVLPLMHDTFDLIHVDGDHTYEQGKEDMTHSHRMSTPQTLFIFDDYSDGIARAVNELAHMFKVVSIPGCWWSNCLAVRTDC